MGRRSATESAIGVLAAFIHKRVWVQSELARQVDLSVRALRACLLSMESSGSFPVERSEEPPQVVWSLPGSWLPEGVALSKKDAKLAVRLLSRLPTSPPRDALLETLLGPTALLHARGDLLEPAPTVLAAIEDACNGRIALRIRYASTTGGPGSELAWRTLSVQQMLHGDHPRFVALERGKPGLRSYRVDRVAEAGVAREAFFHAADRDELAAFLAASIDGFHGAGPARGCVFVVRDPEARWVEGNLPGRGARVERTDDGLRVEVVTAGVEVLARFVVGLGGAARVEEGPLRDEVRRLAAEALGVGAEPRRAPDPPVRGAWKTGPAGR